MCNRAEQKLDWQDYIGILRHEDLQLPERQLEMDLRVTGPATDYEFCIRDQAAAIVLDEDEAVLKPMWFGHAQPGRGPIFNFVSENRDFGGSLRCIVPVSAFFEFTGKTSPKAKHRFTMIDQPVFGIACKFWRGQGNQSDDFAMLTTSPSGDIAPWHDRQIVLLAPGTWKQWLAGPEVNSLLHALPAETIHHALVREGIDVEQPSSRLRNA